MDTFDSLNHSVWDCKYHVVFIPKCRRKTLYVDLRQYLGEVFRKLAKQKESRIEEGHLTPDDRSRAHADLDSAQVLGITSGGVHQREECHLHCSDVHGQAAKLHGRKFLG